MINAKKMAQALISRMGGEVPSHEEAPDGLEVAAQAMLTAFEKKDPKALAQAMRDFSDQYDPSASPPEPEPSEEG